MKSSPRLHNPNQIFRCMVSRKFAALIILIFRYQLPAPFLALTSPGKANLAQVNGDTQTGAKTEGSGGRAGAFHICERHHLAWRDLARLRPCAVVWKALALRVGEIRHGAA